MTVVGMTVALGRALGSPCDYEDCRDDVLLPDCCVITVEGGRALLDEESDRLAA